MYIQTKKAVVLIFFLITVIGSMVYANNNTRDGILNTLVISNSEDLKEFSAPKMVIDEINQITVSDLDDNYENINVEHTQSKTIDDSLISKAENKNVIILIGDNYNDKLHLLLEQNDRSKIILINSKYEDKVGYDNLYKINIDWNAYFNKVVSDLKAKKQSKLVYLGISDDDLQYPILEKIANDNKISLTRLNVTSDNYQTEIANAYQDSKIQSFVNVNYETQKSVIDVLKKLQRDNLYKVSVYQKEKEEAEDKDTSGSSSNDIKNKKKEEVKYSQIYYYGIYDLIDVAGEYDYTLDDSIQRNIAPFAIEMNYKEALISIILDKNKSKNINLNFDNKGLELIDIVDKKVNHEDITNDETADDSK